MLVEGIHLHNIIAVSFFSGKPNYIFYYILGWGKTSSNACNVTATLKIPFWFANDTSIEYLSIVKNARLQLTIAMFIKFIVRHAIVKTFVRWGEVVVALLRRPGGRGNF